MSSSIALRRSPKPGALTAATLRPPRSLLTTSVASASPSTSSAMMTSGFEVYTTASSSGSRGNGPADALNNRGVGDERSAFDKIPQCRIERHNHLAFSFAHHALSKNENHRLTWMVRTGPPSRNALLSKPCQGALKPTPLPTKANP
jgi:hypothetical protein